MPSFINYLRFEKLTQIKHVLLHCTVIEICLSYDEITKNDIRRDAYRQRIQQIKNLKLPSPLIQLCLTYDENVNVNYAFNHLNDIVPLIPCSRFIHNFIMPPNMTKSIFNPSIIEIFFKYQNVTILPNKRHVWELFSIFVFSDVYKWKRQSKFVEICEIDHEDFILIMEKSTKQKNAQIITPFQLIIKKTCHRI